MLHWRVNVSVTRVLIFPGVCVSSNVSPSFALRPKFVSLALWLSGLEAKSLTLAV